MTSLAGPPLRGIRRLAVGALNFVWSGCSNVRRGARGGGSASVVAGQQLNDPAVVGGTESGYRVSAGEKPDLAEAIDGHLTEGLERPVFHVIEEARRRPPVFSEHGGRATVAEEMWPQSGDDLVGAGCPGDRDVIGRDRAAEGIGIPAGGAVRACRGREGDNCNDRCKGAGDADHGTGGKAKTNGPGRLPEPFVLVRQATPCAFTGR